MSVAKNRDDESCEDVARRAAGAEPQIPAVCTVGDLAAVLGVTEGQVRRLHREYKLTFLLLVPQVGRPVRFSGAKVRAWIAGENVIETVTTGRRFFGSARK